MSFMVNKSFVIDILYLFWSSNAQNFITIFVNWQIKFLYYDPFDTLDNLIPKWIDYYLDKTTIKLIGWVEKNSAMPRKLYYQFLGLNLSRYDYISIHIRNEDVKKRRLIYKKWGLFSEVKISIFRFFFVKRITRFINGLDSFCNMFFQSIRS